MKVHKILLFINQPPHDIKNNEFPQNLYRSTSLNLFKNRSEQLNNVDIVNIKWCYTKFLTICNEF